MALAIVIVAMAVRKEFDVGILFSVGTDLKPAIDFAPDPDIEARVEVAAWRDAEERDFPYRLSLGRGKPYCRWLNRSDYAKDVMRRTSRTDAE